jgi:hypothetical protein
MTNNLKIGNVEILTTLEDDPHVNFFPWEMDMQDAAATLTRTLHHLGLLSSVLTDRQWGDYPETPRSMPKVRSKSRPDTRLRRTRRLTLKGPP